MEQCCQSKSSDQFRTACLYNFIKLDSAFYLTVSNVSYYSVKDIKTDCIYMSCSKSRDGQLCSR